MSQLKRSVKKKDEQVSEYIISQKGYEKLLLKLEEMREVEVPTIRDRISTARDHGDLSENAEYHAAREEMGLLLIKIAEIEDRLGNSRVVNADDVSTDAVQIYTRVTLKDLDSGQQRIYTMVSQDEADMSRGRISIQSPIGEGLSGNAVGAEVEITVPAGIKRYVIMAIDKDESE